MYYWDSKRNRLKTKDFDRLNSELFFENARSARKVVLFSKKQLLEECTIGTENAWRRTRAREVSVVVRRMYYWDYNDQLCWRNRQSFSSCQKNVLLGLNEYDDLINGAVVSVVVRRMYYWDLFAYFFSGVPYLFQQLLEECTIGTKTIASLMMMFYRFSSCQKNVLLGLQTQPVENKGF